MFEKLSLMLAWVAVILCLLFAFEVQRNAEVHLPPRVKGDNSSVATGTRVVTPLAEITLPRVLKIGR